MEKAKPSLMTRLMQPLVRRSLYDLYPDLLTRQPLLRVNSDEENASTMIGTSFGQAAGYYQTQMWLQKAINVLANNLAPLPLRVTRGSGQDIEYIDGHALQPLLDNPNPEMGSADVWREWTVNMMLGGECGLEVVHNRGNRLAELWPRQPDVFTVKPESTRYRRVAFYRITDGNGDPYILTPDDFIHFKFYNPLSPLRGLSPVTAVRLSIVIDQLAQVWTRLFFKNQARPDYAIIAPEGVTQSERTELETELSQRFGGDGAHKPVILEKGITDVKVFSWPPKDIDWINQRQMSRDEIAAIVGVPDEIMGYGRDTYENYSAAERVLWSLTIVPLAGLRDGTLTRWMRRIGVLQPDERIQTDLRQVPQLQEDRTAKINQAKVLFEMGVPVNLASEFLGLGLPTVPGGDVGYLPMGMAPTNTSRVELVPQEDSGPANKPEKTVRKTHTEYGTIEHEASWKRAQARLDKPVTRLQRVVKKELQRQQNEVGQRLRDGKDFGRGKWKADDVENIPSPESLFNLAAEVQKWINALGSVVWNAVLVLGTDELGRLGLQGTFDINRPDVQAAVRGILEQVAQKANDTTWTDLVELFREAEEAGEGIVQIQERLSAYFGDRKSDYQTERIARTTMTGASNAGIFEAWNQSGIVTGKEWESALQPGRTRDAHAEAHGQIVGLNEYFTVGGEQLMFPGDPAGSPENIINCLCTMLEVIEE